MSEFWHEFSHLMRDPAHWAFEFVGDFAGAALAWPYARWRIRVHDRKVHGHA